MLGSSDVDYLKPLGASSPSIVASNLQDHVLRLRVPEPDAVVVVAHEGFFCVDPLPGTQYHLIRIGGDGHQLVHLIGGIIGSSKLRRV